MNPIPPSLFVVDDDLDVRQSLHCLLTSQGFIVATFASAPEFLADFRPVHPACLILDYQLPGMNGLELLERLCELHATIPAIVATAHADVNLVLRLMRLGAVDVLLKPVDPNILLPLVNRTLHRDADAARRCQQIADARRLLANLTPRERQLFDLVVEGRSYKEMASTLGISPRTVEHHRAHIAAKLGMDRVAEMVKIGLWAADDQLAAPALLTSGLQTA